MNCTNSSIKNNTTIYAAILLPFLLLFSGCSTLVECLRDISPVLNPKELISGMLYQNYNETITYEVKNANTANYHISELTLEGNFPPNLNYTYTGDTITFSGLPNTTGTYEFTVKITVEPDITDTEGANNLCGTTDYETYKIVIN